MFRTPCTLNTPSPSSNWKHTTAGEPAGHCEESTSTSSRTNTVSPTGKRSTTGAEELGWAWVVCTAVTASVALPASN
eukprot:m51a1_g7266 hypothetical protein (77) ;mRNA; r:204167-204397